MTSDQWVARFGEYEQEVEFEAGIVLAPHSDAFPDIEQETYCFDCEGVNSLIRHWLRGAMREFGKRKDATGEPLDELDAYDILKQMIDQPYYVKMRP